MTARTLIQLSLTLTLLCPLAAVNCKKSAPPQPGKFADFLSDKPLSLPPNCTDANEGKSFSIEGYLHFASQATISDGKLSLDFYPSNSSEGEGAGNSFSVKVRVAGTLTKGDIDAPWKAAQNVKAKGYRTQEAEVSDDALRVHLEDGNNAGAKDKLQLVVRVEPIRHYADKHITACEYVFVSAKKL